MFSGQNLEEKTHTHKDIYSQNSSGLDLEELLNSSGSF